MVNGAPFRGWGEQWQATTGQLTPKYPSCLDNKQDPNLWIEEQP